MCKHSIIYQRENEFYGGIGCPICHAERVVMPPAGTCEECGLDLTDCAPSATVVQVAEVYDADR